jgi:hypothetical protein
MMMLPRELSLVQIHELPKTAKWKLKTLPCPFQACAHQFLPYELPYILPFTFLEGTLRTLATETTEREDKEKPTKGIVLSVERRMKGILKRAKGELPMRQMATCLICGALKPRDKIISPSCFKEAKEDKKQPESEAPQETATKKIPCLYCIKCFITQMTNNADTGVGFAELACPTCTKPLDSTTKFSYLTRDLKKRLDENMYRAKILNCEVCKTQFPIPDRILVRSLWCETCRENFCRLCFDKAHKGPCTKRKEVVLIVNANRS